MACAAHADGVEIWIGETETHGGGMPWFVKGAKFIAEILAGLGDGAKLSEWKDFL